jgi:hypothetical protein
VGSGGKAAIVAAFAHPFFSVDIASIAGSPQFTLGHLPVGSGLVSFNCGTAKALGFIARHELDSAHRDNAAHANVYCSLPQKQRKKAAQKLAQTCVVLVEPSLS